MASHEESLEKIRLDAATLGYNIIEFGNQGMADVNTRLVKVYAAYVLAIQTITEHIVITTGEYMKDYAEWNLKKDKRADNR